MKLPWQLRALVFILSFFVCFVGPWLHGQSLLTSKIAARKSLEETSEAVSAPKAESLFQEAETPAKAPAPEEHVPVLEKAPVEAPPTPVEATKTPEEQTSTPQAPVQAVPAPVEQEAAPAPGAGPSSGSPGSGRARAGCGSGSRRPDTTRTATVHRRLQLHRGECELHSHARRRPGREARVCCFSRKRWIGRG